MGRGRAKAKQTKVARDLKYSTPNTDLGRLQAELSNEPVGVRTPPPEDDPYADVADRYGVKDDDDDDADAPAASR